MAPASFTARGSSIRRMSSMEARPPDAITGIDMASASAMVALRFSPLSSPSREMSVWMIAATPASSKRRAISSAESSELSAQPSTATLPSRASRPTAMRPGKARAASLTRAGSRTAAVPMMARSTPFSSQPAIAVMSRRPPPSCTGKGTLSMIRSTAITLTGRPAKAASRSTTWRYSNPSATKLWACEAASRLNTVARAMSPCSRRTQTPSLRSMAGNRINGVALQTVVRRAAPSSRFPVEEIGDQGKPKFLALFRVELGACIVLPGDEGGDRSAVIGIGDEIGAVGDREMIAVHEIGMQTPRTERDAGEQGMRLALVERVPAHMRDLQVGIARLDATHFAGDPAEAFGHLVFAAALGQELHADADAEERPALPAHGLGQCLHHSGQGVEAAPAIGKGADAGQHHAVGGADRLGVVGHRDGIRTAAFSRGALEGLRRRMQVAGAVIDDGDVHLPPPGSGNRPITPAPAPKLEAGA